MPISARDRGLRVIIAGAGGAAHLPGMAAAWTPLPVLGVPVESHALKGMDSLLSIVQMPAGIPVGTLAIGRAGAVNAALLAAAILATTDAGAGGPAGCLARAPDQAPVGGRCQRTLASRPTAAALTAGARSRSGAIRCTDPLSASAQRDHRPRRRRSTGPHVGDGRRPSRLSLPHPDAGAGQPGGAGVAWGDDQRLYRSGVAARIRRRRRRHQLRVRKCQRRGAGSARVAEAGAALARDPAHQPGPHRREELSSTAAASPPRPGGRSAAWPNWKPRSPRLACPPC